MTDAIDHFTGKYRFLSNFYPSEIRWEGRSYRSVEHAYQASKSLDASVRRKIADLPSPADAKREGRRSALRPDWETVKVDVMRALLRLKFEDVALREQLLSTGDAQLIESNTWGDREWGVCRGQGKNLLGKTLMEVRKEIRDARS